MSRITGRPGLLAAMIVAVVVSTSNAVDWTEFGPAPIDSDSDLYTGRISAVAPSSTDANRLYVAGASGGVWRTTDGGANWTPLTDQLPTCAIGALATPQDNDQIIYAGSGEANYANHSLYGLGLFKSTDSGDTWSVLAANVFAGRTFSRIIVSHADSNVVFAAIGSPGGFSPIANAGKGHPLESGPLGIFRSTDAGASWTHLTNGIPAVAATDLAQDPADADTLYAAIGHIFGNAGNGVYKSVDGGDSWVKLAGGLPANPGRISVAVAPSMPQRLYALVTLPSDATGGGASTDNVYRSDNGGATWTPTHPGNFQATYGWFLSTVVVHPSDPDLFLVGGLSLLRSSNGGSIYDDVTPPHVDIHALAYDAAGRLICGDDGGVHRSQDNGNSWIDLNTGLGIVQFYPGLSLHPTNPDFVLGGTQDNGTNLRVSALDWVHRLGGDGGYTALHPANPSSMFAEFQGTGNLYRSLNGGASFSLARTGIVLSDRNCFVPPVTYSPSSSTTLLYGTHRVYRSTNNGTNWSPISGDLTGGSPAAIRGLIIAPSNAQTVYASTNDGRVLVSTDGGVNFTLSLTGISGWPRVKREMAVDPINDALAYLAVARFGTNQVLRTQNKGGSWSPIDGDLPNVPVNTVAGHRFDGQPLVFAGTDAGVYLTCNGGTNWDKVGDELPHAPVMDLIVDSAHDRLVAGTLGRGVWTVSLPDETSFCQYCPDAPECNIPATSSWGLVVTALVLAAVGSVIVLRGRAA